MLHGMSLGHITSNEKLSSSDKTTSGYLAKESATPYTSWENNTTPTSNSFLSRQRSSETTLQTDIDISNDETLSSVTSGSSSAESYDVIGELSINPNSVEDTMERIRKNDPSLVEVSRHCLRFL